MNQKRTFHTACHQSEAILTRTIYKARASHTSKPAATEKPGSIDNVCDKFQNKSAENWDNTLTQSAHFQNASSLMYTAVGCNFRSSTLYWSIGTAKYLNFDPSIEDYLAGHRLLRQSAERHKVIGT